jgi:integrase
MITVSHREGPDPNGADPLAIEEPRVGFHNKPATGDRMRRRPSPDRSREGTVGSEETIMLDSNLPSVPCRDPWNKGRLIGQKRPLKPKEVWSIRVRLQMERRARNLALFNLAIDSKLRGCDLVRLRVDDVSVGGRVRDRATIVQKKTGRPVQFEITEQTRAAIQVWLADIRSRSTRHLFPSRVRAQPHLSTRQYARIVHSWVARAGLDSSAYGTHSMRRTKAAQIYKNGQSESSAAASRAHEAGKHCALSRHRGRRRACHIRAGRAVS